jgi:hypothetical protein
MRNLDMAWRLQTVGIGLVLGCVVAFGWSCSEALRLEPPSAGPAAGAGGVGGQGGAPLGGGGAAPQACESNTDCATPTAVCDGAQGICVECLTIADCAAKPGTVCSLGQCGCPTEGESWCSPSSCVDLQISPNDCGSCGHRCFGACAGGACVDAWEPTGSVGAPDARSLHAAVWTGTEMVVWGGSSAVCPACNVNTGGIYEPVARTWRKTSTVNAPSARRLHTAVWTGTAMLVWGGQHNNVALGTGASFDPATNLWTPLSTVSAPAVRYGHTAIWTGSSMIVWGGYNGTDQLTSGASYDPATDTWVPVIAPAGSRTGHSAVWTGTDMVVYGGFGDEGVTLDVYLPTATGAGGMQYALPPSEGWTGLQPSGQPPARAWHTAVMLSSPTTTMVVWGGRSTLGPLSTGASYDTGAVTWTATALPGPEGRSEHTAVTLGSPPARMVIWGGLGSTGELDSGGVYTAVDNTWEPTPTALSARRGHSAVSTGEAMIVWGGEQATVRYNDGGVYTPGP